MKKTIIKTACGLFLGWLALAQTNFAEHEYSVFNPHPDNKLTADGKRKLHNKDYPQPPRVEPKSDQELREWARPPDGAVRLDFSKWKDTRQWVAEDDVIVSRPAPRDLETVDEFGSCRVHVEWMAPADSGRSGQNRANSGVFLMSTYEVQILDTYDNKTYPDGMAGALYSVKPPDANPLRPSGQWQYYDLWFKRPTFDNKGAMVTPACVTVYINGILVQDNIPFDGESVNIPRKPYKKHADQLPFKLQYHNEQVSFRNVWIQSLDDDEVVSPAGRVGVFPK
ncbi:MAG: DUF1080 domain-containing protein [Verrucomicrobiales bacterium]|jgi:hypothetical protein|nr:DUF1080 domain-containing protein [Verrucomicrobiales bacterium]